MIFSPETATVCLLSFEGPDSYSLAGGLGIRVSQLAETLSRDGFTTHLLFVGDPDAPGLEQRVQGRLTLHRWCQWISAYHRTGVYEAEEDKLRDFTRSAPPFLLDAVIRPAVADRRHVIILAEEWQTAESVIRLHELLLQENLHRHCGLFWNANNTMSFHRVDWRRLDEAAQLTTVSRYMKYLMWNLGVNPLVIPNGIPSDLLRPVDTGQVESLRHVLDATGEALVLFKVGRFDPAKNWLSAIEAAAQLKAAGHRVVFPLRGGIEAHGGEVWGRARASGLTVADVEGCPGSWSDVIQALRAAPPADIYNLKFFLTQDMLRPFYAAADGVLANSGHEPFGLVGLEAMAAGAVVFTGSTGEEYALYGQGAVPLDTDEPAEISRHLLTLRGDVSRSSSLRRLARARAAAFTWDNVLAMLKAKVEFSASGNGLHPASDDVLVPRPLGHRRASAPAWKVAVVAPAIHVEFCGTELAPGACSCQT